MHLPRLHRKYFDAHVNLVTDIERKVLYEQIVSDEAVLPELDLDGNATLDEIGLVVRTNGKFANGGDSAMRPVSMIVKRATNFSSRGSAYSQPS